MRVKFQVILEQPPGATVEDLTKYIRDELASGCGHYHPDDPLFALDRSSILVKAKGYDRGRKRSN